MVYVKPNVVFHPQTFFRPEMWRMVFIYAGVAREYVFDYIPTITSGVEGPHKRESFHDDGWALDFRIKDFDEDRLEPFIRDIWSELGRGYTVILEVNHIHVHYDKED